MSINIDMSKATTKSTYNIPNRKIEWIVVHYTATPTSDGNRAYNVADGFAATGSKSSADFIVGENVIVQYNQNIKNYATWHCGGRKETTYGGTYFGQCTNSNSIGIEMCSYTTDGKLHAQANIPQWQLKNSVIDLTVELVNYLMETYNIDINHVIRHFDVTGKSCPGVIGWNSISGDESKWLAFKSRLNGKGTISATNTVTEPNLPYVARINGVETSKYYAEIPKADEQEKGTYQKNDIIVILEISEDKSWAKTQDGWVHKSEITHIINNVSQALIDYILKNYVSPKYDENRGEIIFPVTSWLKTDGSTEYVTKDDIVQILLEMRAGEVEQDTTSTMISNNEFIKALILPFASSTSTEDYTQKIKLLFKDAVDTNRRLATSPYSNILIQTKDNALTDISDKEINEKLKTGKKDILTYYQEKYDDNGWNKKIKEAPETLNFWFDFMETNGEMGKYAAQAIGSRSKAVNDDKVKAIYFQETPSVLFLTKQEQEELEQKPENYMDMTGYTFIRLTPQMENYFTISGQGKSAKDELDSLLYNHTYATDSTTLTAVPIYHLQPNTRVFVKDKNTGINGEYIINKITIPLQYNGTSSITTTKAVERIY